MNAIPKHNFYNSVSEVKTKVTSPKVARSKSRIDEYYDITMMRGFNEFALNIDNQNRY